MFRKFASSPFSIHPSFSQTSTHTKLPAPVGPSPPSSSVLVLKLRGRQHDVKLNGCPRGDQVLGFRSSTCLLGTTAGAVYTAWLCSVGMRWTE